MYLTSKALVIALAIARCMARRELKGGDGHTTTTAPPGPPADDIPDLGDQIMLYRDDDGVPILTERVGPGSTCAEATGGLCLRPLAFPSDSCPDSCYANIDGVHVVSAIDQDTCAVDEECAGCIHEVEFGRINVIRSPIEVLEAQYEDAMNKLGLSLCEENQLDSPGRFVYFVGDPDGIDPDALVPATIDSPAQNLGIYYHIMKTGSLGGDDFPGARIPQRGNPPSKQELLITAATSLGAAMDKGGKVTADIFDYSNRILGLTEVGWLDNICIEIRQEAPMDQMECTQRCFLNITDIQGYSRRNHFGSLPGPAYIPSSSPQDGWSEYLAVFNGVERRALVAAEGDPFERRLDDPELLFYIAEGPTFESVFDNVDANYGEDNSPPDENYIGAFVQAADDSRAAINFFHSWPVPAEYATQQQCPDSIDIEDGAYDLYITDLGIQAPQNIIQGAIDREFAVTVSILTVGAKANMTLHVNATLNGGIPHQYHSERKEMGPTFLSYTFTGYVDGSVTSSTGTIEWTAEVEDMNGNDFRPANNVAQPVYSNVISSGGSKARKLPPKGGLRR